MKKRDSKRKHELTVIYHAPRQEDIIPQITIQIQNIQFQLDFMGMKKLSTPLEYNIPMIIIYKVPF